MKVNWLAASLISSVLFVILFVLLYKVLGYIFPYNPMPYDFGGPNIWRALVLALVVTIILVIALPKKNKLRAFSVYLVMVSVILKVLTYLPPIF